MVNGVRRREDDHSLARQAHASLPHHGDGQRQPSLLHSSATAKTRIKAREQARKGSGKANPTNAGN